MYCAECGEEMRQLESGAYVRCCNGAGYWTTNDPAYKDRWAAGYMRRHVLRNPTRTLWLYVSPGYPQSAAVPPNA